MSKFQRVNIRLSGQQIHALERGAHVRGITVEAYICDLVEAHMNDEGPLLILELAQRILITSVCAQRLLIARGDGDDLPRLARETRRLAGDMGVGNV